MARKYAPPPKPAAPIQRSLDNQELRRAIVNWASGRVPSADMIDKIMKANKWHPGLKLPPGYVPPADRGRAKTKPPAGSTPEPAPVIPIAHRRLPVPSSTWEFPKGDPPPKAA